MSTEPVSVGVGRRVFELRRTRGLSVPALAEKVTATGAKMDRFAVSNLERGDRKSIGVHELLALAEVLEVAPMALAPELNHPASLDPLLSCVVMLYPPKKAVCECLGMSTSTASRWIREARKAGLISSAPTSGDKS